MKPLEDPWKSLDPTLRTTQLANNVSVTVFSVYNTALGWRLTLKFTLTQLDGVRVSWNGPQLHMYVLIAVYLSWKFTNSWSLTDRWLLQEAEIKATEFWQQTMGRQPACLPLSLLQLEKFLTCLHWNEQRLQHSCLSTCKYLNVQQLKYLTWTPES